MQYHLDGLSVKEESIKRLQEYEPEEGYYLAFSGGKDSQVLYHLAIEAGVKFDAHFNVTTVDPPELMQFVRDYYPEVEWHRPKKSMFKLIEEKHMPPTRVARYCCHFLKEMGSGQKGRWVLTGIRWSESIRRKSRTMVEIDYKDKSKHFLHPIIDWTDSDVWGYIKGKGLPYCCLYDEGFTRIGCIMCPLARKSQRKLEAERYPKFYAAYLRAFNRMNKRNEADGRYKPDWKTPQDVMDWWMEEDKRQPIPDINIQTF